MLAKYKALIAGITALVVAVAGFFLLGQEKKRIPARRPSSMGNGTSWCWGWTGGLGTLAGPTPCL